MVTLPVDSADTTPVLLIDATLVLEELQTPPAVTQVRVVVAPVHTVVAPAMAAGVAGGPVTVIALVALPVPQV